MSGRGGDMFEAQNADEGHGGTTAMNCSARNQMQSMAEEPLFRAQRKPRWDVELSGVLELRAPTR
jgi:hypothetical protein